MYQFSDSDSVDSDKGVRFKTENIRCKEEYIEKGSLNKTDSFERKNKRRPRSTSPHENKRKRSKKTRKEDSSEDVREKNGKHKDRKQDIKRHRDKRKNVRASDSPDRKHKCSVSPENEIINDSGSIGSNIPLNTENIRKDVPDQGPVLGPALPPHLLQKAILPNIQLVEKSVISDDSKNSSTATVISPSLSSCFNKTYIKSNICGPKIPQLDSIDSPGLPPNLAPKNLEINTSTIIGPALPPNFKQSSDPIVIDYHDQYAMPQETMDRIIGPSLPADLKKKLGENLSTGEAFEEEVYGPIPVGENFSRAHIELEERALKIRIDQLEPQGDKQPTREEWMMTLPEARAVKFGLGPRSFRAKAGPDLSDRSSWTDTPEDKAKKKTGKVEPKIDLQKEAELKEICKRDEQQEALAKKNKKHKESLVEIHQKKLKKEKNESGPSERRPFSREIDLQVNRFDEAQKKAVLKKAQLLDTRFSTGESKYL